MLQLAQLHQGRRGLAPSAPWFCAGRPRRARRRGRGDDDRRAPDPDPDPAQGHGTRPDPRGTEDVHPDPADHGRRDADHLRPDHHHRAGDAGASFTKSPPAARRRRASSRRAACRTTWSSSVMILLFSYFYTSIIFNSVDLAENLKKQGGVHPRREAGREPPPTTSTTCWCGSPCRAPSSWRRSRCIPIILSAKRSASQPQFGGTSVLIVVGVLLDTHRRRSSSTGPAAQVRQLHEVGPGQVPGTAAAVHLESGGSDAAVRGLRTED